MIGLRKCEILKKMRNIEENFGKSIKDFIKSTKIHED